jgi:hypothetical protein
LLLQVAGAVFRKLLATFPEGTVVSVIDFAKNYSFLIQNEIQSMHWYSDQVTILVHIVYRHAEQGVDGRKSTAENQDIVKELNFYISDDKDHGTVFVQHCMVDVHFEQLEEPKVTIQKHVVFSNRGRLSIQICPRLLLRCAALPSSHWDPYGVALLRIRARQGGA